MKKMVLCLLMAGLMLSLCASCSQETPVDESSDVDESSLSLQDDPSDGLGGDLDEDAMNDLSGYEGIWLGDANNDYDYMEIDADGNWTLYLAGDVVADGTLIYEPDWAGVYAYNNSDGTEVRTELENGQLYHAEYGYFNYGDGMEYIWCESGDGEDASSDDVPEWNGRLDGEGSEDGIEDGSGNGDEYYSWDSSLYQRNVSEFEGIWYYDGDLSAETYIVIDSDGNWSYYQRAPGAEAAEMDYGSFTYSSDEASTYYADSWVYDGLSYKVYELDEDVLIWGDEGAYYLME